MLWHELGRHSDTLCLCGESNSCSNLLGQLTAVIYRFELETRARTSPHRESRELPARVSLAGRRELSFTDRRGSEMPPALSRDPAYAQ